VRGPDLFGRGRPTAQVETVAAGVESAITTPAALSRTGDDHGYVRQRDLAVSPLGQRSAYFDGGERNGLPSSAPARVLATAPRERSPKGN
jgi:hypothetical protein